MHVAAPAAPRYTGLVTRAIALAIDAAVINLVAFVVGAVIALCLSALPVSDDTEKVVAAISGAERDRGEHQADEPHARPAQPEDPVRGGVVDAEAHQVRARRLPGRAPERDEVRARPDHVDDRGDRGDDVLGVAAGGQHREA